ncbi:hypothetical protein Vadar_014229 [Vaccinium darrowii]|uniref:Uncharacterized protein n=1 Tax=Vaccinium darrowii TaxID=229202 RepID=A0ACB7ZDS0_9ERIC|nr:hypothetical protein Vadar_014229 [Vaccinium darrowii]
MRLFHPTWLPPLNGHDNYTIHVSAHQAPLSTLPPPLPENLTINVNISVVFFAGLGRTLPGLSLSKFFHIHPSHIRTSSNLISELRIPFPLDKIIEWESEAIGEARSTLGINGEGVLEDTLKDFLCSSAIVPGSVVALRIEKMVQVPLSKFREWCRWYDQNAMASEGFERDYATAIRRPRTGREWVEEVMIGFRSLPSMTMREFLDKEWVIEEEEDGDDGEDDDVTEMMEEEVVVHRSFVSELFERSNVCPLCGHVK